MLFEFQYNYKILTSEEYISDRRRTNLDLCVGGGVGLDIDSRCITETLTLRGQSIFVDPIYLHDEW